MQNGEAQKMFMVLIALAVNLITKPMSFTYVILIYPSHHFNELSHIAYNSIVLRVLYSGVRVSLQNAMQ